MSSFSKKKSLRNQIYVSYIAIAAIGLVILLVASLVTSRVNDSSLKILNEDIPRTVALLNIQVGLNRALASLRGWVAIQDVSLRQENDRVWEQEIFPAFVRLENMEEIEGNLSVSQPLSALKKQLIDLKEWHWYIAEAAISDGNLPAQFHFERYVLPVYHDILDLMVTLIESPETSTRPKQQFDQHVALGHMLNTLADAQSKLILFIRRGDAATHQAVLKAQAEFAQFFEIMMSGANNRNKKQRKLIGLLEKHYKGYTILVEQVLVLRSGKEWHLANTWLRGNALPLSRSINNDLEKIFANESKKLQTDVASVIEIGEKELWVFVLLVIVLIGTALFLARYWAAKLMAPIQSLVKASHELAKGNLDFEIKINSDDEIGLLANSFETMRLSLSHREHQLISSEIKLRTTIATVLDAIIVIDDKGVIQSLNPAACNLFQYQEKDLLGKNVKTLMPEPYKREHDGYLEKYKETQEAHVIGIGREVIGLRSDGSEFPADLAVNKMTINGQQQYVGLIRDITERKKIEHMKDEFVSTVSHELRTPLTSIQGSLALIVSGKLDSQSEHAKAMLKVAHENCDRLALLVNDLLDINKIQSTETTLHMRILEINTFINSALITNKGYADKYGVKLAWQPSEDGDAYILGDENRLHQVLSNLFSNAIKYSPRGGQVVITTSLADGNVRTSVTDNGPGIPIEFRDRLFEKFSQADSSDTRQVGGTGLGLAITREIIEKHSGHIGFDSVLGQGTTFYFELPVVMPTDEGAE